NIYGGAGVHVEYLTRELARLEDGANDVHVLCFGDQDYRKGNLRVEGVHPVFDLPAQDPRHGKFLGTMLHDLVIAGSVEKADIAHGHTWYSHFAGCLLKQLVGAKLVLTTHSLEPHRPWKVEQLGTAYYASRWIEETAYKNADGVIAVSESMRQDVHDLYGVPFDRIRVIPNGIDLDEYRPVNDESVLLEYGIDPALPYVLFVGRITRQKGIIHLVNAIPYIDPQVQIVLAAGAPDTPEIGAEMATAVERASTARGSSGKIVWIDQMLPRPEVIALYSQAAVFVCPSVYEPFGIINLEAMACETPVIASAVGGIPEIVEPGETGILVPFTARGETDFEPADPDRFSRDLAAAVNRLIESPALRKKMGEQARRRVEEHFSWTRIAEQTLMFYEALL
ncbi:MAG TPA: glycogen synthase, partial [Rhodothermales bacterium]|nr:glycogen synthase [Rhodothermales bacterium]